MSKKIFTLLLLSLFVAIVIFVVFFLFFSKRGGEQKQPEQIKAPATTTISPSQTKPQAFRIVRIIPEQDLTREYFPITQVSVIFNMPVSPGGVFYTVDPFVKTSTRINQDLNTIIISVDHWWNEGNDGITTITILQNTVSTSGVYLKNPVVYKIKTAFPKGGV